MRRYPVASPVEKLAVIDENENSCIQEISYETAKKNDFYADAFAYDFN